MCRQFIFVTLTNGNLTRRLSCKIFTCQGVRREEKTLDEINCDSRDLTSSKSRRLLDSSLGTSKIQLLATLATGASSRRFPLHYNSENRLRRASVLFSKNLPRVKRLYRLYSRRVITPGINLVNITFFFSNTKANICEHIVLNKIFMNIDDKYVK